MNDDSSVHSTVADVTSSPGAAHAPAPEKKKRGFATMNLEQVREFARRGGVAAHRAGTAHEFTSDEARAAGRKGGLASHSPSSGTASASNEGALEG